MGFLMQVSDLQHMNSADGQILAPRMFRVPILLLIPRSLIA